ncbi:S9 family peptidase [Coxiella-like endosymbiont]|uniref:S9 family peptidase n=1 Tax=Coxiella-like endosymbiont TaxID=1592897 RepID=UPI00272D3A7C|nr:prolyl oligopeptidase family serine peptidase [Coxiella-like endosymbiont]
MMAMKKQASYGTWRSPISAEVAAASSRVLMNIESSGENIYWLERRPEEVGWHVIMCLSPEGKIYAVTPFSFHVRTRVHEYGGGDYLVDRDIVYFANDKDQRWYRQKLGDTPQPITPAVEKIKLRYADGVITPDKKWLILVRESHGKTVENDLVALSTDGSQQIKVLAQGYDFYSFPRLNILGNKIVWTCWNQPQMPWDGTELWQADITATLELRNIKKIAGGVGEFISQPRFGPDEKLYFLSDKSGFGNIYRYNGTQFETICPMERECDFPQWNFGLKSYDFLDGDRLAVIVTDKGEQTLGIIKDSYYSALKLPFSNFAPTLVAKNNRIIFIGASHKKFSVLSCYDINHSQLNILYESTSLKIDEKYLSLPKSIEFPTAEGKSAYGFYYPPYNEDYVAPQNENPPLIVISHGGPTSTASTALNLKNQFWTSRGFAVFEVNYGGSTGYGKAYRERLKGQWGVVDVADCVNGATYLVKQGEVDPERLIIRGGSAGGYTVLCALVFYNIFSLGVSYFGIADLEGFMDDTHKFESHYLETLVGNYLEKKAVYKARSPLNHTEKLSCPIIFLQGLEDKVVQPAQAEMMIAEMKKRNFLMLM